MATYVTGDTHGQFDRIAEFCERFNTTQRDVLIILGDAGINYYRNRRDIRIKEYLSRLPITLFCIHGNHEIRPEKLTCYETIPWNGGLAYQEKAYPNLIFAQDGEIYDIDGEKTFICGGAYSVDKHYRLANGWPWFPDEQPNDRIKTLCEQMLERKAWRVDRVLTHTCPERYIPREMFLPGIDQSTVDSSTEKWLDTLIPRLTYKKWMCGHYHTDKTVDKIRFLYNDIIGW